MRSSFRTTTSWLLAAACVAYGYRVAAAQSVCVDVNNCTGDRYSVLKDFTLADPTIAPTNAQGATGGGTCTASETYKTYFAWCNESGCTGASPASSNFQPASGSQNVITVTRPSGGPPAGATSWAVYFSKVSNSTVRNCNATLASMPVVSAPATATTVDCKCFNNGVIPGSNTTGIAQTNKLHHDGTINFSAKDGGLQGKLTLEKNLLEYSTDIIPRFSPDAGANYRTVDWNSATVFFVDATIGASSTASVGRSAFNSITTALSAITDSSYTKPYVIKVRSAGGTELAGASITRPYVWLQGDGATRVGEVIALADGVRISGLITHSIRVGSTGLSPSDLDNIWITNNVVTNNATAGTCRINVSVGGGSRYHGIMVSNNRLGGANDPGASTPNRCSLVTNAGDSGTTTVIQMVGNYVENATCDIGNAPLRASGSTTADTSKSVVVSSGNTFNCTIPAGTTVSGNTFTCVTLDGNMGSLYSLGDTCVISRPDSGSSVHSYQLVTSAVSYSSTVMRRAEFINPSFSVSLAGTHFSGDYVSYLYLSSPYMSIAFSNPRYSELTMGSGWTSGDKHFATISGTAPSASNTSLRWDSVVTAPAGDISYVYGASASSISASPQSRLLPDGFAVGLLLEGANLPSTCSQYETRYDTGGSTKELCICDPANTWNCAGLGARQD